MWVDLMSQNDMSDVNSLIVRGQDVTDDVLMHGSRSKVQYPLFNIHAERKPNNDVCK